MELPRYGAERLSGIRCLATQTSPAPPPQESLTAMVRQRLDALGILTLTGEGFERRGGGATGYIDHTYLAHMTPDPTQPWAVLESLPLERLAEEDLVMLVAQLESEFAQALASRVPSLPEESRPSQDSEKRVGKARERVFIVSLITQGIPEVRSVATLQEIIRLVETAGGTVLGSLQQKRTQPHPQTVVGSGKVDEIALQVQTLGANLIVFDRDLSPAQVRNLETRIGIRVIDRTEVILDIFAQHAQTQAGKLQVELAQLEYLLPRLTGRGQAMSRLGGGIGTRGPGETQLETERRAIQRRLNRLQQEVNQLQDHRARLRQRRQSQGIPTVAVVGYTNAGKSTLLNALTHAEVYTADQLFATLDPTTRRLALTQTETGPQTLLLIDTVGFIHELPPPLIDAFRATLEEVTEADALLHVVDISHLDWEQHMQSVTDILSEMPTVPGPSLLVFNKIDQAGSEQLERATQAFPQAVFIAARDRLGLETLRDRLRQWMDWVS